MHALNDAWAAVNAFMASGGPVLLLIAGLTFFMWTLIFERVFYFKGGLKRDVQTAMDAWEARPERKSWNAHQIRHEFVIETGGHTWHVWRRNLRDFVKRAFH